MTPPCIAISISELAAIERLGSLGKIMRSIYGLALLGLALRAWSPSMASEPGAGIADETVRAEAKANRDKMTTKPSFVNGPRAELPESERALGHHGAVIIEGVIGLDGKMHATWVKTSSGLPSLDKIALAAAQASSFMPGKNSAGVPIPILTSMPFELVAYKSATGGIFEYHCDQFVRDMDWWHVANPQKPYSDHELYKMESGLIMLTLIQSAKGDQSKLREALAVFDNKWNAAIEQCRRKPRLLQKDALYH